MLFNSTPSLCSTINTCSFCMLICGIENVLQLRNKLGLIDNMLSLVDGLEGGALLSYAARLRAAIIDQLAERSARCASCSYVSMPAVFARWLLVLIFFCTSLPRARIDALLGHCDSLGGDTLSKLVDFPRPAPSFQPTPPPTELPAAMPAAPAAPAAPDNIQHSRSYAVPLPSILAATSAKSGQRPSPRNTETLNRTH